jgi:hypothetical protein
MDRPVRFQLPQGSNGQVRGAALHSQVDAFILTNLGIVFSDHKDGNGRGTL